MDGCAWCARTRRRSPHVSGCVGWGKEGIGAGWCWKHHEVGATAPPTYLCSSWLILFGTCSHKHTDTYTNIHTVVPRHKDTPLGFPLMCWTWRPTQEVAIEKAGPGFMHLTLMVRSIVKVIKWEKKGQALYGFPCVLFYQQPPANTALNKQLAELMKATFHC